MPRIDFQEVNRVLFVRPDLLLHPMIPTSLHGVNPRTILGTEWWNETRSRAYLENNYHCWACGSKDNKLPLEAHEIYEYDFRRRVLIFTEVAGLCRYCHSFIHIGHTLKTVNDSKARYIFRHGCSVLRPVGKIHGAAIDAVKHLYEGRKRPWISYDLEVFYYPYERESVDGLWSLILNGKEYYNVP